MTDSHTISGIVSRTDSPLCRSPARNRMRKPLKKAKGPRTKRLPDGGGVCVVAATNGPVGWVVSMHFIAIERLLNANVSGLTGVAVIAGYAAIYCLPCVVLVVIGSVAHDKVGGRLQRLVARFTTGVVKRSVPIAAGSMVAGVGVAAVPFFL